MELSTGPLLAFIIDVFVVVAQEFKFTTSCHTSSQLTTYTNNKSCQSLNDKFDKLLLSLAKDDKSTISVRCTHTCMHFTRYRICECTLSNYIYIYTAKYVTCIRQRYNEQASK